MITLGVVGIPYETENWSPRIVGEMEESDRKSDSRKIKMLRYDHFEEYKDYFLQFSQNNNIETHFTNEKDGVWGKFGICYLMHR